MMLVYFTLRRFVTFLFVRHLLDLNPALVCEAAERQRKTLKNPSKTIKEYLETLTKQGFSQDTIDELVWCYSTSIAGDSFP